MNPNNTNDFNQLSLEIKQLGKELGFSQIGITDTNLAQESSHLESWLASGTNGDMRYFKKHLDVYEHPQKLLTPSTRIICCSISYPKSPSPNHPIASFAKTQDYSSHIRELLKQYVEKISLKIKILYKTRVFAGNAPVLEKALAAKAGIGWYGKNSILLHHNFGSYFFLGEIFTDLPLPIDKPIPNRCGNCFKCKKSCPTQAIVAPHKIDARRCIAYLTIEHKVSIPIELRPLIGNKIFGCDICQQVCPWNKDALNSPNTLFTLSKNWDQENLITWFLWSEQEFQERIKDSPMSRINHEQWLRNIAVALGNSPQSPETLETLKSRLNHPSDLVREHVEWAVKSCNFFDLSKP